MSSKFNYWIIVTERTTTMRLTGNSLGDLSSPTGTFSTFETRS